MKKILVLCAIIFSVTIFFSCGGGKGSSDYSSETPSDSRDYRQDMRDFVIAISAYARANDHDFIVIPQNGHELLTEDGEADGNPATAYISAIDGVGREDLLYGYDNDNTPTPSSERNYMTAFMDVAENAGVEALIIDYCSSRIYVDDSYAQNNARGYISFAADHRELDNIPAYPAPPYNVNSSDIRSLFDAKNFLYLLNSDNYATKEAFIEDLGETDYDVIVMDLFFNDGQAYTPSEIASLKTKAGGGTRLVIAYMSIGEAEEYRYYWQSSWDSNPPAWLSAENPDWEGNYKVRYWISDWQNVIYGNDDSYTKQIMDAGFDGVYLDIIDAFEYFE